jgi:hypothetical protein
MSGLGSPTVLSQLFGLQLRENSSMECLHVLVMCYEYIGLRNFLPMASLSPSVFRAQTLLFGMQSLLPVFGAELLLFCAEVILLSCKTQLFRFDLRFYDFPLLPAVLQRFPPPPPPPPPPPHSPASVQPHYARHAPFSGEWNVILHHTASRRRSHQRIKSSSLVNSAAVVLSFLFYLELIHCAPRGAPPFCLHSRYATFSCFPFLLPWEVSHFAPWVPPFLRHKA